MGSYLERRRLELLQQYQLQHSARCVFECVNQYELLCRLSSYYIDAGALCVSKQWSFCSHANSYFARWRNSNLHPFNTANNRSDFRCRNKCSWLCEYAWCYCQCCNWSGEYKYKWNSSRQLHRYRSNYPYSGRQCCWNLL